jgi:hypothetical protein
MLSNCSQDLGGVFVVPVVLGLLRRSLRLANTNRVEVRENGLLERLAIVVKGRCELALGDHLLLLDALEVTRELLAYVVVGLDLVVGIELTAAETLKDAVEIRAGRELASLALRGVAVDVVPTCSSSSSSSTSRISKMNLRRSSY